MITPDAVNNSGTEPWNHTCATDSFLTAAVYTNDGTECPDTKYNGVSMVCQISGGSGLEKLSLYSLANPTPGTHAIDVTIGGAGFVAGYSASYLGVDQTNPVNTVNSSSAPSGTSYSHSLVPTSPSWVISAVIALAANISAGANTTARAIDASGFGIYDSNQNYSGSLNWNATGDTAWLSMAMGLKARGGAGGFMPIIMRLLNHK